VGLYLRKKADVKTQNILINSTGTAYILDFWNFANEIFTKSMQAGTRVTHYILSFSAPEKPQTPCFYVHFKGTSEILDFVKNGQCQRKLPKFSPHNG